MNEDKMDPPEAVLQERERCLRISTAVEISARNFRDTCRPGSTDWETWDTRRRAASDILTVIRSGGEA